MATKKVSYITLLKEAMKNVHEFDSSQLDVVMPQVKQVLDYDGKAEMKTSEKTDASSILERYYFREENEPADVEELEDEIAGDIDKGETLEDECLKREEVEEKKEEEETDKEVLEAYRLFKEQEEANTGEEAGTKKENEPVKEPADQVGEKDITPNKEAGTLKEADEDEEEAPEAELEDEEDEEEKEEETEQVEVDAEQAVVEKLIAELEEEEPEGEKEEGEEKEVKGEEGAEEDEKKVEEGIAGAVGGAALGAVKGGVPGALVGGAAGHLAQKKFLKDQEEVKDKDEEEEGEEGEEKKEEEEPLDVDKKLVKEILPALPRAMANKATEYEEAKLIKEAQDAINYFLEEEDDNESEEVSSKDIVV